MVVEAAAKEQLKNKEDREDCKHVYAIVNQFNFDTNFSMSTVSSHISPIRDFKYVCIF